MRISESSYLLMLGSDYSWIWINFNMRIGFNYLRIYGSCLSKHVLVDGLASLFLGQVDCLTAFELVPLAVASHENL